MLGWSRYATNQSEYGYCSYEWWGRLIGSGFAAQEGTLSSGRSNYATLQHRPEGAATLL